MDIESAVHSQTCALITDFSVTTGIVIDTDKFAGTSATHVGHWAIIIFYTDRWWIGSTGTVRGRKGQDALRELRITINDQKVCGVGLHLEFYGGS